MSSKNRLATSAYATLRVRSQALRALATGTTAVAGALAVLITCSGAEARTARAPAAAPAPAPRPSGRPNFVVILADDLGFADVGFNGRTTFKTPNIDRLAREGTAFRRFYSGGVICGPSRAAMLTGQYTIHTGVTGNLAGLAVSKTTIASALKPLGYRSMLVGKWDNGELPLDHGFDEFIGYSDDIEAWEHFPKFFWFGREKRPVSGYSPDLVAQYGMDFIKRQGKNPYFLYLAFTEPHLKLEAPPADVARLSKGIKEYDPAHPYNATYAAMVERFDAAVGRFLDALQASGQANNTIVVFSSDHGATFEGGNLGASADLDSNRPFQGGKRSMYEGGMRVPAVIRWPGHIPSGAVSGAVLSQIDILPTLMAAAGSKPDPAWEIDGADQLAVWEGKARPAPRTLFWEYRNDGWYNLAAMSGDWKLVVPSKASFDILTTVTPIPPEDIRRYEAAGGDAIANGRPISSLPPQVQANLKAALGTTDGPKLYNIAEDPQERRNYYFTRSAISAPLRQRLLDWLATEVVPTKPAPKTSQPPAPGGPD
jgi:arylsulfatase A-like enzyme